MSAPDMQVALDALLMLGVKLDETQLQSFIDTLRELDRQKQAFRNATDLRFEDFARRDQRRAVACLRLISDLAPLDGYSVYRDSRHVLDEWRAHGSKWGFES